MKKFILPILISSVALYSCGNGSGTSTPSDLVGNWTVSSSEFVTEDSLDQVRAKDFFAQIDTLKSADPDMVKEFKTSNLDSIKFLLKESINSQLEMAKSSRQEGVKNLSFDIKSDGTVIQKGEGENNTANWYTTTVNKDRLLFLDPIQYGGKDGESLLIFKVEHAASDSLRLSVYQAVGYKTYLNFKKG